MLYNTKAIFNSDCERAAQKVEAPRVDTAAAQICNDKAGIRNEEPIFVEV